MTKDNDLTSYNVREVFGSNVFSDAVMRERLSAEDYAELKNARENGEPLPTSIAPNVAAAMKNWAVERGATHYSHWFQPLTGVTAEKHEAFLTPTGDGAAILELSARALAQGESDASSFPSGGLRATFEARGYTTWDYTSPAFLKEDLAGVTLCIPTAFRSYTGEALDEKTPMLRAMEALNKQGLRILRLFGDDRAKRVSAVAGAEQEYFLVDQRLFNQRMDMVFTGRTLFGARPPKSQEMEGHYYGALSERVALYMKELDYELWKMGVAARIKHNEVAPAQHELVPFYTTVNIAADQNQMMMETMQRVAGRHELACLLHEKPFEYINGSGKHNNWSLSTDSGENLLLPGKNPESNTRFLVFLCAIIKAIDQHAELLRHAAASPGNDYRLGGHEAPPAIISVFLGSQLMSLLESVESGRELRSGETAAPMCGSATLPCVMGDMTDRNRTSPFAFTGNKFEFRMLPSSLSISEVNVVLSTIVAEALDEIATRLESATDLEAEVSYELKKIISQHKRVIFNGNGYSEDWIREAAERGLPNITNSLDAMPALISPKTTAMFEKYGVFTRAELEARCEVKLEKYIRSIFLEASTMLEIVARQIMPAIMRYQGELAAAAASVKALGCGAEPTVSAVRDMSTQIERIQYAFETLRGTMDEGKRVDGGSMRRAEFYRDRIRSDMTRLRACCDAAERMMPGDCWPFPTYNELLFNI
ncbi:glutamine synthetase [Clostridia bacterium]|nr:glutamine synthetase [Clostridia bacterium]